MSYIATPIINKHMIEFQLNDYCIIVKLEKTHLISNENYEFIIHVKNLSSKKEKTITGVFYEFFHMPLGYCKKDSWMLSEEVAVKYFNRILMYLNDGYMTEILFGIIHADYEFNPESWYGQNREGED